MLPKWLCSHKLVRKVIFRDSKSFHNLSNGLFKTMDVLQDKAIIVQLVGKEFEDPGKNLKNVLEIKHQIFNNLISKLFHYSSMAPSSVKANQFINSLSSLLNPNFSQAIFKDLMEFFSEENDSEGINMVKQINNYGNQLENTASVSAAMEAWKKGKISYSFNMFSEIYDIGNSDLQKEILRTLQGLVFYSIEKKGKAIVNSVIECSTHFCLDKKEFSLLVCVWYALFTSEIYEDRCLAEKILVTDSSLQKCLEKYVPWLGYLFLKNDELTNYQRLIETALYYNMSKSVNLLLRNLFNYYYQKGYFSGCSAVYKCCIDLNIKLSHNELYK